MRKIRKPVLLILLLAFTGQLLVANALTCQTPLNNQANPAASDMAAIDHSAHHMPAGAAQAADNTSGENCCDMGVCAMSHCQSAVTLPLDYFASSADFTPVFSRHNSAAAPSGVNDSLYRPPIFR